MRSPLPWAPRPARWRWPGRCAGRASRRRSPAPARWLSLPSWWAPRTCSSTSLRSTCSSTSAAPNEHRHHTAHPVDDAGADLRRRHRHALDGHPARLRPLARPHHHRPRLEPRDLRLRHRGTEPGLGPRRPVHGRHCRSLRCFSHPRRRHRALCGRPGDHGPGDQRPRLPGRCRAPDRHRAVGDDVCGGLRRDRPQRGAREAQLGHGRRRRGRLLRPVPDGAHRRRPHRRHRLAGRPLRAGSDLAGHRAAGLRPARAGTPRRHRAHAKHRRRGARGARQPELPTPHRRLLRVRLPGGLHRRAHAELPQGPRPAAARGHHGARPHRPLQR